MENKSKNPLISVVMLNYNGLKHLKRTIPPIVKLDYPNYEFIIVDNGSTDGSIEFVKKFKKIKLIENGKNLGYSKGKNIGVKHAKGEYVLLLDNDIQIIKKSFLNELIILNEKDDIVQVPFLDYGTKSTKMYGIYYWPLGQKPNQKVYNINKIIKKKLLYEIGSTSGGLIFIRKKMWEKLGGFDESQPFNIDDTDLGPRAWIMGSRVKLYTGSYILHLGVNNAKNNKNYIKRFRLLFSGQIRSIIKNFKFRNIIIVLPLAILYHIFKSIRCSILRKDIRIFFAFCFSVSLFLKNLPDTLKQRKIIQSKRVIKEDIFLKIKPPKFD